MKAECHRCIAGWLVGVTAVLILASGCIRRVDNARPFNEKLGYVPWQQLVPGNVNLAYTEAGKRPSQGRQDRLRSPAVNASGLVIAPASTQKGPPAAKVERQLTPDAAGQELRFVPGMQITFFSFPSPERGQASSVPGLAEYRWLVPNEHLNTGDYLFLSYIFTAGRLPYVGNLPGCFDDHGTKVRDDCIDPVAEFNKSVTRPTLAADILHSLGLSVLHADPLHSEQGSAAIVREWMTRVSGKDFDQPTPCGEPWQIVSAHTPFGLSDGTGPTDVELRFYDWNTAASNDDPFPACDDYGSNMWYQGNYSSVFRERGYVTVEVPIRIHRDTEDRQVPVYWSYQDLENSLSDYHNGFCDYRIRGFRRNIEYLPPSFPKPNEFAGAEKYFTVWFGYTSAHHYGAHRIFRAGDMKKDLLVAPGDIVYISRRHHIEQESKVIP